MLMIIVLQRMAVAGSCAIFFILATQLSLPPSVEITLFIIISLLACVEKVAAIMNSVSVERDWVCVATN